MNKKNFLHKGMVLISILMLTVILIMLTTSMLIIVGQTSNIIGKADLKTKAIVAAEGGIEFARYQLSQDPTWGGDPNNPVSDVIVDISSSQRFTITFDTSKPYFSYNNIDGENASGTTPRYSVEIISKGSVMEKGTEKKTAYLRAIFIRDDDYPCPVYSAGNITIDATGSPP
ncbi:MAG: hypothetical protein AB1478_10350, partial [Nitrospirota bacterium]